MGGKTKPALFYLYQKTSQYAKEYLLYFCLNIVFTGMKPLVDLLLMRIVLSTVFSGHGQSRVIVLICSLTAASAIAHGVSAWLRHRYHPSALWVRIQILKETQTMVLYTPYTNLEDASFLDGIKNAVLTNSNRGIEGMLHAMFSLSGLLIPVVASSIMIGRENITILLMVLIWLISSYFSSRKIALIEAAGQPAVAKNERYGDYYFKAMSDFAYGKDIRIFNFGRLLGRKYKQTIEARVILEREKEEKISRVRMAESVLRTVLEIGILAILVSGLIRMKIGMAEFTYLFSTIYSFTALMEKGMRAFAECLKCASVIVGYQAFIEMYQNQKNAAQLLTKHELPPAPYTISFENVSYQYREGGAFAIRNLNLTISAGTRLGIVGHNGAGKTTLVKLLTGMYKPTEGRVCINGVDISKIPQEEYYNIFSTVFQDYELLAFTLGENIAATSDYRTEDVEGVLKEAGIEEAVARLPHFLDTHLTARYEEDGTNFSGGQRQRIAFARAIYKNGDIFVLDEPTSALDPITERSVYEQLGAQTKGKATIFISHRLASTQFCDEIALIERGVLIEQGTHEALLAKGGTYAALFEVQSQYYREEVS